MGLPRAAAGPPPRRLLLLALPPLPLPILLLLLALSPSSWSYAPRRSGALILPVIPPPRRSTYRASVVRPPSCPPAASAAGTPSDPAERASAEEEGGGMGRSRSLGTVPTRRGALLSAAAAAAAASSSFAWGASIPPALAAPPMTAGEADNVGSRVERALRPKPPRVLRSKLKLDFAVLLMRSSYNALDNLDCVPMDQFQRDFFLIRQAEYQPYASSLGPGAVAQGDLIDPNYFDFISFAQYAAISRDVRDPPAVFEERRPKMLDEGTETERQVFVPVVVRRTVPADSLARLHGEMVGEAIVDKLDEVFGTTEAAIPPLRPGGTSSAEEVLAAIRQLAVLFVINGFAWEGAAEVVRPGASSGTTASGTQFSIALTSPATLWSGRALQLRGADPTNDFILKAAGDVLRRGGYGLSGSSVKYDGNGEITTFTVA